jgi:hypothetical protein
VDFYLIGWLVLLIVFVVTQTRFHDAHRGAHAGWRPRSTPWLLSYDGRELRAMGRAAFQHDNHPVVERRRRIYVAVLVAGILYLVVGLPLAIWVLT